jgi:hypothetical protein
MPRGEHEITVLVSGAERWASIVTLRLFVRGLALTIASELVALVAGRLLLKLDERWLPGCGFSAGRAGFVRSRRGAVRPGPPSAGSRVCARAA